MGRWHLSNECFFCSRSILFEKGLLNPVYRFGVLFSFYFLNVCLILVTFGNIYTLGNNEQSIFLTIQYSQLKPICQFLSFLTRIRIRYILMITIFAEFCINALSSRLIYSTCPTLMMILWRKRFILSEVSLEHCGKSS